MNVSITRYTVWAVADYGALRFCTGQTSIASTQDLQLISGLPVLVREGDHYQAMVTARNSTTDAMRTRVVASYAGKGVAPESLAAQDVDLDPGAAPTLAGNIQDPEAKLLAGTSHLE